MSLFRIGRFPRAVAGIAAGPGVLFAADGLRIRATARGLRMPGRIDNLGVRPHRGGVVLTADRLVVSIGRSIAIDVNTANPGENRALTCTVDDKGVHIAVNLAEGFPGGKGTVEFWARTPLEPAVITGFGGAPRVAALSSVETQAISRWA